MLESELTQLALESTCVYFLSRIIDFTSIPIEVGLQINALIIDFQIRNSIGWEWLSSICKPI